jgi:MFS family permease
MAGNAHRTVPPFVSLIVGNVLFATGLIFHAFLYNFYLEALGLSPRVMGHAAAALTGGGLAMLLPAGWVTDRASPRVSMTTAGFVLAIGLALGAWAAAPPAIYAAAALAGAGSGLWRVATPPILMELTEPGNRARAFAWNVGMLVSWGGIGTAAAGAASTGLEHGLGLAHLPALRAALVLGAALSATSLLLFRRLSVPAAPAASASPEAASLARPASPLPVLPLVGLVAVWMLGAALAAPFFNIYFARHHSLSIERVGFLIAAANVVWALAVFGSGEVASRIGVRRLLVAALLFFAPAMIGLSLAQSLGLAAALFLIQGLVGPVTNPLIDQWLLGQVPRERRGAVSSWRQVAADASAMAGASLGGLLLAAGSFTPLFAVAGAVGLVGALGLIAGVKALGRR